MLSIAPRETRWSRRVAAVRRVAVPAVGRPVTATAVATWPPHRGLRRAVHHRPAPTTTMPSAARDTPAAAAATAPTPTASRIRCRVQHAVRSPAAAAGRRRWSMWLIGLLTADAVAGAQGGVVVRGEGVREQDELRDPGVGDLVVGVPADT